MASGDVVSSIFNLASGAVQDLFNAKGARLSAEAYRDAANISETSANIERESTGIQVLQQQRELYKTLGKQQAGVAGAGFEESGTAIDLLRDSASQGAIQKAVLETQGAINVDSYEQQARLFTAMADAADNAKKSDQFGALLSGGGALFTGLDSVVTGGLGSVAVAAKSLGHLF
jgi:hypothetical protein